CGEGVSRRHAMTHIFTGTPVPPARFCLRTRRRIRMRKTLAALSAAAVIGAGTMTMPTQADAHAWWVVPVVIGGVILGTAAVASTAQANAYYNTYGYQPGPYAYGTGGGVYVQPRCQTVREQTPWGMRRV